MQNKYQGICFRCNTLVEPGKGNLHRAKGEWKVQHTACKNEAKKNLPKCTCIGRYCKC